MGEDRFPQFEKMRLAGMVVRAGGMLTWELPPVGKIPPGRPYMVLRIDIPESLGGAGWEIAPMLMWESNEKGPNMRWSSDVPTVEGWYWFIDGAELWAHGKPRPVYVEEGGYVWVTESTAYRGSLAEGSLFLGPITPAVAPPSASNEKEGS
jgi:hypothetical protein